MSRERLFRSGDEAAAFDWARPAHELDVPLEIARALYVRAMRLTLEVERAEALYLRWLREAAATRRPAATPLVPGRRSRVTYEASAGPTWDVERAAPGKWTRALLETREHEQLPGSEDVQRAIASLVSSASRAATPEAAVSEAPMEQPARTMAASATTVALRNDRDAVATTGRDALEALARADPATTAAAVRDELRVAAAAGRGAREAPVKADPATAVAALRDELQAAAMAGRGAREALAKADPATAAAALRELRGEGVPFLRLVTRAADGEVERVLGQGSTGAALPADLAARMSPHVTPAATGAARLHTDDTADLVAAAHHARALTVGSDIYFARGEYAPGTARGDELLAHELTHVAQGQRGELTRAAAKGIDSGATLDPAEAEADLRARLAVIELHPAQAQSPPLAGPTGQPTSAGARQARLAAQQQRMNLAGQTAAPLAVPAAPPATRPQAPVPHQAPKMTPPPQPAPTGNAYVDAFAAPPSKQALELWGQAGAKATTQVAADQAKFDAGLPPMPIALDGSEAKGAKGAAAGAKANAQPQPPAQGAAPPAAAPSPTPPAPPVTTAQAAASAIERTEDKAQLKADGQKLIDNLPTRSPDVKTDPGPAPVTELAGQADPVRAMGDQQRAVADSARALDDAKAKVLHGPGAAQVQPAKLDEKLAVPREQPAGTMPQLPTVEGMQKMKKWNLPTSALGSFDELARPKMEASLAQGKARMHEAEARRDADRSKAVGDAQDKVKTAHADADKQQQAKVAESRTQIANHQADTLVKHESEIKKLDQQSGAKKQATVGKINTRISADQAKVEADYKDAQKKAEGEKQKGEAEAQKKKEEAQKKQEDKSWWDQATDAICDGIQAIAEAIDQALEAIGKAIGDILDAVKDAACKVIDAARDFVCQALTEFGDWLKSAVTALLGSVFPELAAALNRLIDQAVNAAKAAVNAIADGLKKAVTALCDGLKAAVNAVIAAFKAAVQAAATFAQALVTGDWSLVGKMILEGILKLLGIDPAAFYALIAKAMDSIDKIIENPGAFVGHLIDAVKLGFQQFGANFWTHLKNGLVQWLFGTFAEAGITMPKSFDIAGIFDLVCQILGLTWPRLKVKIGKVIGEKNVERLEFAWKYVEALITGGFSGLWAQVQQDLSGLWDMVVGGVKDWILEKIVQQAILKIATMWNPAGAIIQLIQTAWNVYCWIRENAQRIFGLVQAVVDSIASIVAGNIGGAANFIEASLAKLVPIAISLFANLLGLGGIAGKIKDIITKIQTQVDQAIDKLIARVLGLFKGKGQDDKAKDGLTDEDIDTPKTLVETQKATIKQPAKPLSDDAGRIASGTVLYQAPVSDPKAATKQLLADHPSAKFDKGSRALSLPPLPTDAVASATDLKALAKQVSDLTGVSKVTFTKHEKGWSLDGSINPTVMGLVTVGEVPAGLQEIYQHCVAEQQRLTPDIATMIAICNDAGQQFSVTVNSRQDPVGNVWYITFSKPGANPDRLEAAITAVDQQQCPACGRPYRELRGPNDTSRPHNVIPQSMWTSTIRNVLQQFGVTGNDDFINAVLGTAGPGGNAVSEDRQCRECERIQDQGRARTGLGGAIGAPGSGPQALPQRRAAARLGLASTVTHPQLPATPGPEIYTGPQFARLTESQVRELVRLKVSQVIDDIRRAITMRPSASRPATHPIYTLIVRGARVDLLQGAGANPSQEPGAPATADAAGNALGPTRLDEFLATLRAEITDAANRAPAPGTSPP